MARTYHPESGPNPTDQAAAESQDISKMAAKHLKARLAGNILGRVPIFMEVPSASFHDMLNKVVQIQSDFHSLPSKIRAKFMNNPNTLLSFVQNPDNHVESVRLGLIDDPETLYHLQMEAKMSADAKAKKEAEKAKSDAAANPPIP